MASRIRISVHKDWSPGAGVGGRCHTGAVLGVLFGRPSEWPSRDLIGYSEEFDAPLALEAYRCGVFPMPLDADAMGWWSPMQRGLLPVAEVHVTRSLRKSARRYITTVDADFQAVVDACADPRRPDGWIDERVRDVYGQLHDVGWVHSVEVWDEEGALVGGLYGLHVAGLFAGESMFHDDARGRDASKVALIRLCIELAAVGVVLLDVQWLTEHLGSLGAYEVPREEYLRMLSAALELPTLPWRRRDPIPGGQLIAELGALRAASDPRT